MANSEERNITQEKGNAVIFISHSSADKEIADMLVEFLAGTEIPIELVFCSSLPGNDVKEKVFDEVKSALKNSVVNIAILSKDYFQSAYCLNEAGVFWYSDVPVVPIALPEITAGNTYDFPSRDYNLHRLDSKPDVSGIYDTVSEAVSAPKVTARLITYENEKLRKKYLKWIEERKQQNPVNPGSNTYPDNDPVMTTDLQDIGIKQIYPKGQAVKSIEKELKSDMCKEIRVLAFSAEGFTHSYRYELTNFVARGGHLKYLLSRQDTLFIQQAAEMEGRSKDAITKSVNTAIDLISSIYRDAEERSIKNGRTNGTIEVRLFDTEIRNQLIMCTDSKNRTSAWMSILIPPRAAVNCQMIEYTDAENCIAYFNTIWKRHEKDTIAKAEAAKKAEEGKKAVMDAFEKSGKTVEEILEFLKK